MYVGCWQCAKCLWVMCNGTYVWVHVIQLLVYAWVSCSSRRGMYGEAVFTMDVGLLTCWSPPFFGLQKNWIRDLALEAETAISKLPTADRYMYRQLVTEHINTLKQSDNTHSKHNNTHPETKTIKTILTKLQNNDATVTRADKGNAIVILPTQHYHSKLQEFIHTNNFKTTNTDPTKSFQIQIRKTINNSKTLIPQEARWKYVNMNPSAPTIKGVIEIHKPNLPIRPVVSWRNTPAYRLAKLFTQKIRQLAPLPNKHKVENT